MGEQQFENHSKINFIPSNSPPDGSPPDGNHPNGKPPNGELVGCGEVEVGEEAGGQQVEETREDNATLEGASINIKEQNNEANDIVANVEVGQNNPDTEMTEGKCDCSGNSIEEPNLGGKKEIEVKGKPLAEDDVEGMVEKEDKQNEASEVGESQEGIETHENGEKDKISVMEDLVVTDEQPEKEEAD